jgi:hypothetical protein
MKARKPDRRFPVQKGTIMTGSNLFNGRLLQYGGKRDIIGRRGLSCLALMTAVMSVTALDNPTALGAAAVYQLQKSITVRPQTHPAVNPSVTINHFEHVWWERPEGVLIARALVKPQGQSNGYTNIGGREGFKGLRGGVDSDSVFNHGTAKPDTKGIFPKNTNGLVEILPDSVLPEYNNENKYIKTFEATVAPEGDGAQLSATGKAIFEVEKIDATTNSPSVIKAKFGVEGNRTITQNAGEDTYAFSYAKIRYAGKAANTGNPRVRVNANPTFTIGRQQAGDEKKEFSYTRDPVMFSAFDEAGDMMFRDWAMIVHGGVEDNAYLNWLWSEDNQTNSVQIRTFEGEGSLLLYFTLNDALVGYGYGGHYLLEIEDQRVVQREQSGIFGGLPLPDLNEFVSSLDLSFSSLAFDLTPPVGAVDYQIDFVNAGVVAVPEPGTLFLLAAGGAMSLFKRRR